MNRNESVVSPEMTRRNGAEVEGGKRGEEAKVNTSALSSCISEENGEI